MRAKRSEVACANERAISVFARPGVVLEQHVAVAQQRQQDQLERPALADDRLLDLGEDRLRALLQIGERAHSDSSRSITAATLRARHARPVAVCGLRPVGAQQLPHVLAE